MLTAKEVPLDSITLREEFQRGIYDQQNQADLVQSIKARGIIYPLICMETPEGLTLVAGYRRYHAAQNLGLPAVPCICLKVGIDDAEILRLHENLYREDITPVEEAQAMARLETTYHFTRAKIANLLGKSPAYVTQRLTILHWNPELRQALASNQIHYSVARELAAVTEEDSLHAMLEQIISSGASVRTVITWVQKWKGDVVTAQEQLKTSQPPAETGIQDTDAITCYFCARYIGPGEVKRIELCKECLKKIAPASE